MFKKGFSTLEILIALFIFAVVASGVVSVFWGSQNSLVSLKIFENLLAQSQFQMEKAKALASRQFNEVVSTEENSDEMEKVLEVSFVYDYTKKLKSRASRLGPPWGLAELTAYVSDWEEVLGAGTCFRKLENIYDYSIASQFILDQNFSASDIDVVRGISYITLDASSIPNFLAVSVADMDSPTVVGQLATGIKLKALHVAGRYVFLATQSTAAQIQIIDVFEPTMPELVLTYRLPFPSATTTAESIFYNDQNIFLGTQKNSSGPEFHILDVSDPEDPLLIGTWETGMQVNSIAARNGKSFIANASSTPLSEILDTSDPQNIERFDHFEYEGPATQSGQKLSLVANYLVLGRFVFPFLEDYQNLFLFDVSEDSFDLLATAALSVTSFKDIIIRENLIVAAVLGEKDSIQFFNFTENQIELVREIELPGRPEAIDCEDDIFYVVTENPAKLIIIAPK